MKILWFSWAPVTGKIPFPMQNKLSLRVATSLAKKKKKVNGCRNFALKFTVSRAMCGF